MRGLYWEPFCQNNIHYAIAYLQLLKHYPQINDQKKKKFAINAIREVRSLGERERGFTKK